MFSEIPERLAVTLKDRLRGMRHQIRNNLLDRSRPHRDLVPPYVAVIPEIIVGGAVAVLDRALTTAETISLSVVSANPRVHFSAPVIKSLDLYFGAGLLVLEHSAKISIILRKTFSTVVLT